MRMVNIFKDNTCNLNSDEILSIVDSNYFLSNYKTFKENKYILFDKRMYEEAKGVVITKNLTCYPSSFNPITLVKRINKKNED